MAYEFNLFNELTNPRIDQLPPGEPVEGDYIPYWDKRNGMTKRLSASMFNPTSVAPTQNFEWIPNRKDGSGNPFPYSDNDVVTYGGNWYQSQIDNNNFVPGVGENWLLLTKSFSGGFWKAGVYTDARPWVFSDHTGLTEIYELVDPARPFVSTNIDTEHQDGKWRSMSKKVQLETIDTSQTEIVFDLKHDTEKWFKGSHNIDGPRILTVQNDENVVEFKFMFTMSGLFPLTLPIDFKMSDVHFNSIDKTWTPSNVGNYKAVANWDGENYKFDIYGPYEGGGNQMPTIFDNVIARNGNILDGSRSYFDAEGDLENNPPPQALNLNIDGTGEAGEPLTAQWTFFSPFGYAAGAHVLQWYRENEDGSNRVPLPGFITSPYTPQVPDIGYVIRFGIIPVQVAPPPSNGNPVGVEVFSPGILIESPGIEELDLATVFTHYMKHGTWDDVNKRYPDLGLSGGSNFFAAPATREPVLQADGSLDFDPTGVVKALQFPVIAGTSVKTHDFVGLFKMDAASITQHMWAIIANTFFRFQNTGTTFEAGFNGTIQFAEFEPAGNTWYAYRLRLYTNGTIHGARLQINKNIENGTYEFDLDRLYPPADRNGTIWSATTGTVGASPTFTSGFNGKLTEHAFLINAHLDPSLEDRMWTRLNNVKALLT